jgi:DNA-binding IclR family transcriptional regulator
VTPDLDDRDTKILLALVRRHRPGRPVYLQELADETGAANKMVVYRSLQRLRRLGLVAYEDNQDGTLRPLVRAVAVRRRARSTTRPGRGARWRWP